MCMFMMKTKKKKEKPTPEQKAKAMAKLVKKFSQSDSGRSMARWMQYLHK